ncbi:MAG: hypothetical protein LBD41_05540 [Clostridiales Family XIII bacterium]|jgi:uncharacterized membrane protein|nr:hypothetical protein [Clostridiales Family XIII bacterium]
MEDKDRKKNIIITAIILIVLLFVSGSKVISDVAEAQDHLKKGEVYTSAWIPPAE